VTVGEALPECRPPGAKRWSAFCSLFCVSIVVILVLLY
jgi:hypothetical protein